MARQYGHEKVSLTGCLHLLNERQPLHYRSLVELVRAEYRVSERTAKDALSILAAAGYVHKDTPREDARQRIYTLSDRGRTIIEHRAGPIVLRVARALFTTNGSAMTLSRRQAMCKGQTPNDTLIRIENYYLGGTYAASLAAKQHHRQIRGGPVNA